MKLIIEGCTAEELAETTPYLRVGVEYDAEQVEGSHRLWEMVDDEGDRICVATGRRSMHLPSNARWVQVE